MGAKTLMGTGAPAAGGGPPPPTTVLEDAFTEANGTHVHDHTIAPTNTPSTSWTDRNGTWDIQGNKANCSATGAGQPFGTITCSPGLADCTLSGDFVSTAANNVGHCARYSDNSNMWWIEIISATNTIRILERNAATNTVRASASVTITAGTSYALAAILSGQTITATVDGANQISYALAALNVAAQIHGMHSYAVSQTGDNWKVTNP